MPILQRYHWTLSIAGTGFQSCKAPRMLGYSYRKRKNTEGPRALFQFGFRLLSGSPGSRASQYVEDTKLYMDE